MKSNPDKSYILAISHNSIHVQIKIDDRIFYNKREESWTTQKHKNRALILKSCIYNLKKN